MKRLGITDLHVHEHLVPVVRGVRAVVVAPHEHGAVRRRGNGGGHVTELPLLHAFTVGAHDDEQRLLLLGHLHDALGVVVVEHGADVALYLAAGHRV